MMCSEAPLQVTMKTLAKAEVASYLDANYLHKVPHLNVVHSKLLVIFSGGNGVGKSSLSARIQADLNAFVIENDAIRAMLLKHEPELNKDRMMLGKLLWEYTQDLYPRLGSVTTNGLVVRDAVIDWHFDKILPIFEQNGYKLFIIRFELSRERRLEILRNRGGKDWISLEVLEGMFDKHEEHSKRFLSAYTPDIIITDETVFDYDRVVDALRKRI